MTIFIKSKNDGSVHDLNDAMNFLMFHKGFENEPEKEESVYVDFKGEVWRISVNCKKAVKEDYELLDHWKLGD